MRGSVRAVLLGTAACGLMTAAASMAQADEHRYFTRVATVPVYTNLPADMDKATETAAEIMSATADGMTLVYTDSPGEALGFFDISNPAQPKPLGRVDLGGEPTSVYIVGDYALVAVNTSESYTNPSGHLAVVSVKDHSIVAKCDVGGQPDSVGAAKDGKFVAIAVESERDEELNDGEIPQLPPGGLAIFDLDASGKPTNCDAGRMVDVTGLADVAPSDPEPEYVDFNGDNLIVMTLQENNHLVVVDAATGVIKAQFPAGAVSLTNIDTKKDKAIIGNGSLENVAREPDAVSWLDNSRFVTANEGDYKGGSRGFTIWNMDGTVEYDSGSLMEHLGMSHGHYPEKRAGKKGVEPETVDVGVYGEDTLFFVNSERGNFVVVFKDNGAGQAPEMIQFLPTHVAPEGLLALPQRDLFVVATEADSAEDGVRATVDLYAKTADTPFYPMVISGKDKAVEAPIGWGALSGLVGDATDANKVYAVSDSFYAGSPRIYTLDVSGMPARITDYVEITGYDQAAGLDPEGISRRAGGGFWIASEGNLEKEMHNLLLAVGADGKVEKQITLPEAVEAESVRFGFEGAAAFEQDGHEKVIVAVQREWKDDPKGLVKLGIYDTADESWSFVHYPLEAPRSPAGGWVGLSEITSLGGLKFALIERDNKGGPDATIKTVTVIDLDGVTPAAAGGEIPVVKKSVAIDLLPSLASTNGWINDKPEGFTVTADGRMLMVTDNDGVDDASGETLLIKLGSSDKLGM